MGKANFHIERGSMEVGIGHHGEPGMSVHPTTTAADMAERMLDTLLPDLPFARGDKVAVLLDDALDQTALHVDDPQLLVFAPRRDALPLRRSHMPPRSASPRTSGGTKKEHATPLARWRAGGCCVGRARNRP